MYYDIIFFTSFILQRNISEHATMTETNKEYASIPPMNKDATNPLDKPHDSSSSDLPLGWTRMRRQCSTTDGDNRRNSRKLKRARVTNDLFDDDDSVKDEDIGDDDYLDSSILYCCKNHRDRGYATIPIGLPGLPIQINFFYRGTVIFCLMDHDPKWFQGYFFPQKPDLMTSIKSDISSIAESPLIIKSRDLIRNTNSNMDPISHLMSTILKDAENNNKESQLLSTSSNKQLDQSWIKPWGLLCIQEEIDECLQCQDGGYRQISMTVNTFQKGTKTNIVDVEQMKKSAHTLNNIVWTGGDMMRLLLLSQSSAFTQGVDESSNGNNTKNGSIAATEQKKKQNDCVILSVETDKVYTGVKTVPFIEKYFGSLVRQLSLIQEENNSNIDINNIEQSLNQNNRKIFKKSNVLELMPNVAIVIGTMKLCLEP